MLIRLGEGLYGDSLWNQGPPVAYYRQVDGCDLPENAAGDMNELTHKTKGGACVSHLVKL